MSNALKQHREFVQRLAREGTFKSRAVEEAFGRFPRHAFLPDETRSSAYQDHAVAIKTQTTRDGHLECVASSSQPSLMAMMLELLDVRPGMRVLEIGTGSGYNTALLCHLVGTDSGVYSLEIDGALSARAAETLKQFDLEPELHAADALSPFPFDETFDRIIATAGVSYFPRHWFDALSSEGRVVIPYHWGGVDYLLRADRLSPSAVGGHLLCFTIFTGLDVPRSGTGRALIIASGLRHALFYHADDILQDPEAFRKRLEWNAARTERFTPFSSHDHFEGFHIFTLLQRPFAGHGLSLCYSDSDEFGFEGYALYAAEPATGSLLLLPMLYSGRTAVLLGRTGPLLQALADCRQQWQDAGHPRLRDYEMHFDFSDHPVLPAGGWMFRNRDSSVSITLPSIAEAV